MTSDEGCHSLQVNPFRSKQNCSRQHFCCYLHLSKKIRLDVSCESSAEQRIYMKYQVLFPLKYQYSRLSSAALVIHALCLRDNFLQSYSPQRCKARIRFILYILYYKVFCSSCCQIGHDLIDPVKSSPEEIKTTASICKCILCDDGSAACSGTDASMQ